MKHVDIYTDGACSGNPGKGGWAAILIFNGIEKVISDGYHNTTNNRMELFAILNALLILKEKCNVTVYSDSSYAINPFINGWIATWQENDWTTKKGEAVKNVDIWKQLILMTKKHNITFVKVKGQK